ncbi:uncharacterized protein [Venturia canescens]|uniref:uncharacterized protein n=1 Tax=Venturia canescens TaxID=32260 RepID=UPI001C9C3D18|nr:uncharacterized protein LOC122409948 [Venturia canescens]
MSGAPARGAVPRRPRRHHHHHHHHRHHHHRQHRHHEHHDNNNDEDERQLEAAGNYGEKGHSKVNEINRPKVNPIFLWALQREQRIIQVRCEDYDKRNRIKLTKTAHGWRSIPRTASNVYTNGHPCVERICESPAGVTSLSSVSSSPNSSRWSPATISSSNHAAWSVSSARSGSSSRSSSHLAAISSPSQEGGETSREVGLGDASSVASRSRTQSDGESINDFDYACPRSAAKLRRIGKDVRKRRRRDAICTARSEKTRKALNNTAETRDCLLLSTWNEETESNKNNDENSTDRVTGLGDVGLENTSAPRTNETRKKRKHERNLEAEKRKRRRRNSEGLDSSAGLSVMSSPRSWERLMNGTRFLHSGPVADRSRPARQRDSEDDDDAVNEDEERGSRDYEKPDESTIRVNNFGTIDLERARKDQHLQPRVVLEQLRLSGTSDTVARKPANNSYENYAEREAEQEKEIRDEAREGKEREADDSDKSHRLGEFDSKERGRKKTVSMSDKSEIRDILSMLDSTGSPVLATDTPTAHLPSSLDSTKTNISSCYENRDCAKQSVNPGREEPDKNRLPPASSPIIGRTSTKSSISDISSGRSSEHASRDPVSRLTTRNLVGGKRSDSPSAERERVVNGKTHRRGNIGETVDSGFSELGTSSEILEALRSTPGLSVSVTTRPNPSEPRHESTENVARNPYKRPASAVYLDKLLPNSPQQSRQSAPPTPCFANSEVTCSQEPGNELTLEAILATPGARSSEKLSGPGLAAIVNRLSSRPKQAHSVPDYAGKRLDQRTKDARLDCPPGETANRERSDKQNPGNGDIARTSRPLEKRLQPPPRHRSQQPRHNYRSANRTNPLRIVPPAKQLRHLMDNSKIPIPDPLLVPRDRLPALAAAPAIEIPKLLAARPELRLPEALTRPDLLRDPDLLVISLAHLQQVLDQGDGSVCEYTYRPPHPTAFGDEDEEEFGEEDELIEREDVDEEEEEEDDGVEDLEEEEDQDVPEQSLSLYRSESIDAARVRGLADGKPRNQRRPPKLISCKPIGSLMPGPIDLSRNCSIRSTHPNRSGPTFAPGFRQSDAPTTQLPPPPLLRVRSGLLKQESEVSSTEIPSPCVQDDSHLWHPLFGSQKRQMQQHQRQQQQQPAPQAQQQQQQSHRTPWHRTTLAS